MGVVQEGDILDYKGGFQRYVAYDSDVESFIFRNLDGTYAGMVAEYSLNTMKVVGNIYENKDMLRTNTEYDSSF